MDCPVCLESINSHNMIILGRCGHAFCPKCWNDFQMIHKKDTPSIPSKCPCCKNIIHTPSVIKGDAVNYVQTFFQKPLLNENKKLREILFSLVNLNRKELGQWKYDYKLLIERLDNICNYEETIRDKIKDEYAMELIEFRTIHSSFLTSVSKMRRQMRNLTKKYKSPPRQRSMPPDPVDIIPPDLISTGPSSPPTTIQMRAWAHPLPSNLLSSNLMIGSILHGLSSASSSSRDVSI